MGRLIDVAEPYYFGHIKSANKIVWDFIDYVKSQLGWKVDERWPKVEVEGEEAYLWPKGSMHTIEAEAVADDVEYLDSISGGRGYMILVYSPSVSWTAISKLSERSHRVVVLEYNEVTKRLRVLDKTASRIAKALTSWLRGRGDVVFEEASWPVLTLEDLAGLCSAALTEMGYDVKVERRGLAVTDVVGVRGDEARIVRCIERDKALGPIGVNELRDFVDKVERESLKRGGRLKATLISTSGFTQELVEEARELNVELLTGNELIKFLLESGVLGLAADGRYCYIVGRGGSGVYFDPKRGGFVVK